MKILIAGANGYIGSRLLLRLLDAGHDVVALVKNSLLVTAPEEQTHLEVVTGDLLEIETVGNIPKDIDIAFYLVHAMSYGRDFPEKEARIAKNFIELLHGTRVRQVIYLSGLVGDSNLSRHLASRLHTEVLFEGCGIPYTILRAGIIIGSGSASFEIIRDLVERLPLMIAPKWVDNLCQPIGLQDVLRYLTLVMLDERCFNNIFDVGGPDQLSYKEMLLAYAKVRGLNRYLFVVPVLTPRLSSYWLYFVTSVNFSLACSLVDSLKNQAICKEERIRVLFPQPCLTYVESIRQAIDLIEQNPLIPSWKDALISPDLESKMANIATMPFYGCYIDRQKVLTKQTKDHLIEKIWAIGGNNGWYYMNWAWSLRGVIDKVFGGVGLQRGRSHQHHLRAGYTLDFWRVVTADKERGYLLLYAEMKLPGEAWLEFRVGEDKNGVSLVQTAAFRSKGLLGRLYWYLLYPFHFFIFRGMAKAIAR